MIGVDIATFSITPCSPPGRMAPRNQPTSIVVEQPLGDS